MQNKETLYLVYWDNGKWVGGYERRGDNYSQIFNDPINCSFVYNHLKKYKEIKVMTQHEFTKVHKICPLQDYCETLSKKGENTMYEVEFNVTGHRAKTLKPEYIGEHNGWIVAGEIYEDYYKWVNEFTAQKIGSTEWVKGDFEKTVTASSKKAYDEFVSLFPPDDWDYWDI